ncbi:MAG: AMP-binding protein [Coriobacteriia bacterium]|nr:AMP-binding protein [Coriobacteriia bacterium]
MTQDYPWLAFYDAVPHHLEYPDCTMCELVEQAASNKLKMSAFDFMGSNTTYVKFLAQIKRTAAALIALGIEENDTVTICLPNVPQALIMFYAVNKIGAISNMIHPLSSENEIKFFLNSSNSKAVITLDQFYNKFREIRKSGVVVNNLIITSVRDVLPPMLKLGYDVTDGRKVHKIPETADVIWWDKKQGEKHLFTEAAEQIPESEITRKRRAQDPATMLYSGGTTGTIKGILLSNLNFNALATQILAANPMIQPGESILTIMPMFHGFGLGISAHTALAGAFKCILVPRFTPKTYVGLLKKYKPNYIAVVPTLLEALLRIKEAEKLDLSCLKGVFSGGDSLSADLKRRFDELLKKCKCTVTVREGYGTTECVTASCLTPYHMFKEGSVGIPLPDMVYKIVKLKPPDEVFSTVIDGETVFHVEEAAFGEEGEICLAGPTVMLGYLNQPEETASTLRRHADGLVYVHTGDLGVMDEDGFVYFRQRIKRMIVTNGYNVYPSRIEDILDAHSHVQMSCVIGMPDPLKMQKVKAFVMLKPGITPSDEVKNALFAHCKKNIAKYAMPYDIEFRDSLPKTLVGKVAYRVLEEEEAAKAQAQAGVEL